MPAAPLPGTSTQRAGWRPRFTLRTLFAAITLFAIWAFVFRLTGVFESVIIGIATVVMSVCLSQRQQWSRWIRVPLLTLSALAVWMVGVDYSEFGINCDQCHHHWYEGEFRILGQPIWSRKSRDHFPILKAIAEDLGAPCPHVYERWHKIRLWGLIKPGPPFINGTCCLYDRSWNDEAAQARLRAHRRALAAQNPRLGKDFQQALIAHDFAGIKAIVTRIQPEMTDDESAQCRVRFD